MSSIGVTIKGILMRLLPRRRKKAGDFTRRRRYSLQLVNQSSLTPVFSLRFRKGGLWVAAIFLFVLIGAIWFAALNYTPLRNALPIKMQADLRDEYTELSMRLDSVNAVADKVDRYSQNILAILLDSATTPAAVPAYGEAAILPLDSLMEASEAERSFVHRFEAGERYNLSVLSPIAAEAMTFYPPVEGVGIEIKESEGGIPHAAIALAKATPVSAIYRGTVVSTYFTTGRGITVVIQHPNDFMSIYTGLAEVFVARGSHVSAGTRLGMAMESRYPLTFEMWHNGSPLSPEEYINF